MRAYKAEGKTQQEAERLIYRRARGSEARAAAQVRMALKRLRGKQDDLKNVITDPQKTDKLGLAITMLLRELRSGPGNLNKLIRGGSATVDGLRGR